MDAAEYTIIGLNAALGLGLAWPLAGFFARLEGTPRQRVAFLYRIVRISHSFPIAPGRLDVARRAV